MNLLRTGAVLALATICTACQRRETPDDRPEVQAYRAKLEQWRRDSMVIDSLSRLVNIDSLVRLRRLALQAGSERAFRQEMLCEFYRLSRRHGYRPAQRAAERVDAAFSAEELTRYDQIKARTGSGLYRVSDTACGPIGEMAPQDIDGVSLTEPRIRPRHPDSLRLRGR